MTTLAVQAAALERFYPDAGDPWRPSALHLATHPYSALGLSAELARAGKAMNTVRVGADGTDGVKGGPRSPGSGGGSVW